jgi:hypothetical protein
MRARTEYFFQHGNSSSSSATAFSLSPRLTNSLASTCLFNPDGVFGIHSRPFTEKHIRRIVERRRGFQHSPETKRKLHFCARRKAEPQITCF